MNLLRVLSAIVLGASLAACGPSAREIAQQQEAERARAAALLRQQATEAEQFVRGHTRHVEFTTRGNDGVDYLHKWDIEFEQESWLTASHWRWHETEMVAAASRSAGIGSQDQLTYIVVASDLTTEIKVTPADGGWYAVTFECRLNACISVSGQRTVAVVENGYPTGQRTVAINEQRLANSWLFPDQETAQRVSIALRELAQYQGAQAPAYTSPSPPPSAVYTTP
jgi:hypothetical protein